MSETIAAVVVTYNRKKLLHECLDGILAQTRPVQGIILIDNASTDGTPEMLQEIGILDSATPADSLQAEVDRTLRGRAKGDGDVKLHYLRLPINSGSSGGFHAGVKKGYDLGYDRLWMMDDDCLPEHSCLRELMNPLRSDEVGAPWKLVTGTNTPVASSGTLPPGIFGKIPLYPLAFNGLLIGRLAIQKIGFPRREFFIDKDDSEYTTRANEAGFKCHLVVEARLSHPDNPVAEINILGKKIRVVNYAKGDRIFFRIRNLLFLHRLHKTTYRTRTLLKAYSNEVLVLILKEFSLRRVWLFLKGLLIGTTAKLSVTSIEAD